MTDVELRKLFDPFGEISDIYISQMSDRRLAMAKFDYQENAERARRHLHGTQYCNKILDMKLSPRPCTIRVKNLSPTVTNELLLSAFGIFGEVDRAIVETIGGIPTGEALVSFRSHIFTQRALYYCNEESFFLISSLMPVVCELADNVENRQGYSEFDVDCNSTQYQLERSQGPRLAEMQFQHEYGQRWKQLWAIYEKNKNDLEQDFLMARNRLYQEMKVDLINIQVNCFRRQVEHDEVPSRVQAMRNRAGMRVVPQSNQSVSLYKYCIHIYPTSERK